MQTQPDEFSDIRPYSDEDIPRILAQILENKDFLSAVGEIIHPKIPYALLKVKRNFVKHKIEGLQDQIKTVDDYQHLLLNGVILDAIIDKTVDEMTSSGLEQLDKNKAYLFISILLLITDLAH